jgi:hypothetical protein
LSAADTWQLVTAGICGGRHGIPQSIAAHPAVVVTLTAPSFGAVHGGRGKRFRGRAALPSARPGHCQLEQSEGDFRRFASAIHQVACDV